jgi:hypothetical protein
LAYQAVEETEKAVAVVETIENAQLESGAIPAASKDGLTTGFYLSTSDGSPWLYYQRGHVGATAWYLFAKLEINPYWIGADTSSAEISLNHNRLNFGYIIGGTIPGTQTVTVSNTGSGTLNWYIASNSDWLSCSPDSGMNTGLLTVTADPTGLGPGNYNGTLTVTAPNASNSPRAISSNLIVKLPGAKEYPFGSFDTPIDGSTVTSSIPVTGWALDDTGVDSVKIYRKQGDKLVNIGDAVLVEGARPDIAAAYPDYPYNTKAGWGYMMLTNFLPNGGNGTFVLHAIAADGMGYTTTLGTKTIYCDNQNAVKPFGAIDTPTQGGTASGSSFINWGWALTPQPNSIPIDGSTINVIVDGVNIGHPNYNVPRADIASLFPSYANSSGAAGYFYLDTTAFSNGVHTIQWVVTDSAGNTDGIGSRYFDIFNSSSSLNKKKTNVKRFYSHTKEFPGIPVDYIKSVRVKSGDNRNCMPKEVYPDDKGIIHIEIEELEKLEIHFFDTGRANKTASGRPILNISPLPTGSAVDAVRGVFYWQLGPGFIGNYRFLIIERLPDQGMKKQYLHVRIVPKFSRSGKELTTKHTKIHEKNKKFF